MACAAETLLPEPGLAAPEVADRDRAGLRTLNAPGHDIAQVAISAQIAGQWMNLYARKVAPWVCGGGAWLGSARIKAERSFPHRLPFSTFYVLALARVPVRPVFCAFVMA